MEKSIRFKGRSVYYTVKGNGEALLFLHGYLESSEIWSDFISRFDESYKVICVDIPGHGKSEVLGQVHTMKMMAEAVNAVLYAENVNKLTILGHSMGGYITMEFVNTYPQKTRGYCLFHSTCFADNDEKKLNRDREISLVLCGKKMQIIHTNVPKAFADNNIKKLNDQLVKAKQIAKEAPEEGIIALLRGMKEREDHSELFSNSIFTPLIIWGKQDNYIGEATFNKLLALAPEAKTIVLENSGHMGFIEEAENAYKGIISYLNELK